MKDLCASCRSRWSCKDFHELNFHQRYCNVLMFRVNVSHDFVSFCDIPLSCVARCQIDRWWYVIWTMNFPIVFLFISYCNTYLKFNRGTISSGHHGSSNFCEYSKSYSDHGRATFYSDNYMSIFWSKTQSNWIPECSYHDLFCRWCNLMCPVSSQDVIFEDTLRKKQNFWTDDRNCFLISTQFATTE